MSLGKIVAFSLLAAGLCVPSAPAASPAEPSGQRAADEAFLRGLFAGPFDGADSSAGRKRIDDYLARRTHDANSLQKLLATEAAYPSVEAGWHRGSVRVTDGARKHDVSFVVHVPRSYRPARPHAMLLAAHGQHGGGEGMARTVLRMLGPEAEKYLVVAPTMPGPRHYSGKAYQEQAYLRPLRWVRRRYNVDDDRICLAGYSQGGHGTWHLATLFPRHFAAAVAMAGTPWFQGAPATANLYLENLSNVRFWSIWGELDKPPAPAIGQVQFNRAATRRLKELGNANYRGTELRGVGHGGCWPDRQAFAAFLAAGKRSAVPEKFAHFFHLEHHKRGYYLEAIRLAARPMRMDGPIRIKLRGKPSDTDSDRAVEDHFRKLLFKMWGELDRKANRLTVRTSRIRSVRVYVTEGLFDLSQPVTVCLNGRSWRLRVPASPACMLAHYAADRDATALVVNEIDVAPAGTPRVRYKR